MNPAAPDNNHVTNEGQKEGKGDEPIVAYTGQLVTATRLLWVFTVVLAVASAWQVHLTNVALDDQRTANGKQIARMDSQLVRMDSQVSISRETMQKSLRAYLKMSTPTPHWADDSIEITLTIMNEGQTPATKTVLWYSCYMENTESKVPFGNAPQTSLYIGAIVKSSVIDTAMIPSGSFTANLAFPAINWIKAGVWDVFFWGFLEYKDAFNRSDTTPFRFKSHWNRKANDFGHFFFCKGGNG